MHDVISNATNLVGFYVAIGMIFIVLASYRKIVPMSK